MDINQINNYLMRKETEKCWVFGTDDKKVAKGCFEAPYNKSDTNPLS